jgi:HAD superfamily hydrolase (TIGR01509 family)
MIKAVIFDMDGLLIDSEPFWQPAQVTAFKTVGIELTQADLHSHMGRRIEENIDHQYHKHPWEGPSRKDIEAMIVDQVIASVKREGKLRPGARKALDLCRGESLPMAIASSSSAEIIDTVLNTLDIRGYFKLVYSADNETHGKPHPGVFVTTAELLGVPAQACLVFEDSPSGVLAAKAAKMRCVAVPEPGVKDNPFIRTADIIIDSLEEFNAAMLGKLAN